MDFDGREHNRAPMSSDTMTTTGIRFALRAALLIIFSLGVSLTLLYVSYDIYEHGSFSRRGKLYSVHEHPIGFWLSVAIAAMGGAIGLVGTLFVIWRVWRATPAHRRDIEAPTPFAHGRTRRWIVVAFWILVIPFVIGMVVGAS